MSHLVTVKTQLKDVVALAAACRRLGLVEPVRETVHLFSGQATGLAVRFPGWQYPVVVDVEIGSVHLDDFGGEWGDRRQLDQLLQAYAVERTRLEARKKGFSVNETTLLDDLVNQAQTMVRGVEPQTLRANETLRQHVATQLSSVQAVLDGMLVDRPRRNLIRNHPPEGVPA